MNDEPLTRDSLNYLFLAVQGDFSLRADPAAALAVHVLFCQVLEEAVEDDFEHCPETLDRPLDTVEVALCEIMTDAVAIALLRGDTDHVPELVSAGLRFALRAVPLLRAGATS